MRATLVYRLSDVGRRAAAKQGLPATQYVKADVEVPQALDEFVYVDAAGKVWLSMVRDNGVEKVGVPREAAMTALPSGYSDNGGSAYPDLSVPPVDPDSYLRLLAEMLPLEQATKKAAAEASEKEEATKRENDRLERLRLCTEAMERLEANPSLWRANEIKDAHKMHGGGYMVPDELKERMRVLESQYVAMVDARKELEHQEKLSWIATHGSDRLKRCVAENCICDAAYMDERLAMDRQGWTWYTKCDGESSEPRNPPMEAFEVLDEARKVDPGAQLFYHVVPPQDICDDEGYGTGDETDGWRGYTAEAEFLGATITFGLPKEYWGRE